jgi:hypothetical protein
VRSPSRAVPTEVLHRLSHAEPFNSFPFNSLLFVFAPSGEQRALVAGPDLLHGVVVRLTWCGRCRNAREAGQDRAAPTGRRDKKIAGLGSCRSATWPCEDIRLTCRTSAGDSSSHWYGILKPLARKRDIDAFVCGLADMIASRRTGTYAIARADAKRKQTAGSRPAIAPRTVWI